MQARSHVSQIAQSKQSRSPKKKTKSKKENKQKTKEKKAIPVRKIMDDPPENASPNPQRVIAAVRKL